jgi:hypothetical protein
MDYITQGKFEIRKIRLLSLMIAVMEERCLWRGGEGYKLEDESGGDKLLAVQSIRHH